MEASDRAATALICSRLPTLKVLAHKWELSQEPQRKRRNRASRPMRKTTSKLPAACWRSSCSSVHTNQINSRIKFFGTSLPPLMTLSRSRWASTRIRRCGLSWRSCSPRVRNRWPHKQIISSRRSKLTGLKASMIHRSFSYADTKRVRCFRTSRTCFYERTNRWCARFQAIWRALVISCQHPNSSPISSSWATSSRMSRKNSAITICVSLSRNWTKIYQPMSTFLSSLNHSSSSKRLVKSDNDLTSNNSTVFWASVKTTLSAFTQKSVFLTT